MAWTSETSKGSPNDTSTNKDTTATTSPTVLQAADQVFLAIHQSWCFSQMTSGFVKSIELTNTHSHTHSHTRAPLIKGILNCINIDKAS